MLAIVWLLSAFYVGSCLKRGWVPWDAGMLGQAAERVLQGQVPFRDFGEVYTGGLTYLNALAFRLFGSNLFSLRIPLFIFFLGWVPAVYAIARRFAGSLAAALTTLLAVAWSVPNYTEAMPSWYNLFFATWGTLALLRYTKSEKRRWLWIAGLCGGLSIAVKITGLYFVAAGLLFFAFREQSITQPRFATSPKRAGVYRPFLVACLILFLAALLDMFWQRPSPETIVHFVLPGACLAALLLWRERRQLQTSSRARFRALFSMAAPFLAGAFLPVAALLFWYAHLGASRGFFEATFLLNMVRMQWLASEPASPLFALALAPAVLVFLPSRPRDGRGRRFADLAAPSVFFAVLLVAAWKSWTIYWLVGLSASLIVPLVALGALVWLRPSSAVSEGKGEPVILVVFVGVLCALIQFPLANPTYFNYVAPLEILAVVALASLRRPGQAGGQARGIVAVFYLIFAVWLGTPGFFAANVENPARAWSMQTLSLARAGGIRVIPQQAAKYARLIPLVQAHARGPFIYAAPDCPEVYFLSGFRNPMPTLYDFLDADFLDVPARTERILGTIRDHNITAVVLVDKSGFSWTLSAALRAALDAQFPRSARVGDFEVRWKP